ncbi:hypothetical protein [Pseudophaeobacter leonis]|uniref:hypothetical protein n=1 Tax=Pseudophaeobacter leonis TaxID=1144477 RepID=UPI0009F65E28|nr:hypothetical protein [Pseudophaeobacter leonis]
MAATGGTGGLGALPLAGVGAAVVVVGGAVMAWLGVFDSDDVRRIVDRESSEESTVVISPSATNPVITEGLSLQPDPDASDPADTSVTSDTASDPASDPASDQLAEQASDVAVTQIQPGGETQDDQPPAPVATPQVAAPLGQAADSQSAENTAAAEANADTGAAVIATPEAEAPSVAPSPAVVPVSPVEPAVTDQQVAAADPTAAPATGDLAQVKTDDTNASVEPADTQTAQAQDALQNAQGLDAPSAAEPRVAEPAVAKPAPETTVVEAPVLEAPRLDLVRVDPTGQTVIAGRAAQGVQVSILLDGEFWKRSTFSPAAILSL